MFMSYWLASANDIRYGWSSWVWLLVSANGILDGWSGCVDD
jgi:hypothetical protein